jgi:hypothetical protein
MDEMIVVLAHGAVPLQLMAETASEQSHREPPISSEPRPAWPCRMAITSFGTAVLH